MTVTPKTNDLTTEWHAARLLYPLYAALAREFVIDPPPCADLEAGVDGPSEESVEQARQWRVDMEQRIQVHQLRQLLQTTTSTSDGGLNELLSSGMLEKGRTLKTSAGDNYFTPVAMVAFTRFSFLMRRVFFRLMHQDLNAILDGLRELELRGVSSLDCRSAQFSADEPVARLRMICHSWKVMFHAEYSSGQPLRMLVDLRIVIDAALARTAKNVGARPSPEKAKAAAASIEAAPQNSG